MRPRTTMSKKEEPVRRCRERQEGGQPAREEQLLREQAPSEEGGRGKSSCLDLMVLQGQSQLFFVRPDCSFHPQVLGDIPLLIINLLYLKLIEEFLLMELNHLSPGPWHCRLLVVSLTQVIRLKSQLGFSFFNCKIIPFIFNVFFED